MIATASTPAARRTVRRDSVSLPRLVWVAPPRPIFWYRIVGGVALVFSLAPDVALALGGAPMLTAMRFVGPLTSIGAPGPGGPGGPGGGGPPAGGGPGAGGPPPGFLSGMSLDQVLVLMLLHIVVGVICITLLTTLSRKRAVAA